MTRQESVVVQVFVFKNGEFYGSDCFASTEIKIGRGEDADLRLDGDEVSRDHAVLRVGEQGLILEDSGSANGTSVNGEAVERVFIQQWDEVSIGEFTFKAKLIGAKKKRPPIREVTQVTRAESEDAEPTMVEPPPVTPVVQDDEEDLEHFVEPFSLLSNLVRESFEKPAVPTEAAPVMEVIRYSTERQVRAYDQVSYGKRYRIGPQKFPLLRFHDRYACRLTFTSEFTGGVIRGNRTVSLDELKTPKNLVSKRRGTNVYAVTMMKGDYANLTHQGSGAFMRFVNPPTIPRAKKKLRLDKTSLKIMGSTFAAHLLFIAVLGFLSPKVNAAVDRDIDKFARVDLQDIPMTKPEDDPEYPVYSKPTPTEEQPKPADEKPVKTHKKPKAVKKGGGKSRTKGGGGGGEGMMAALGQLGKKKGVAIDTTNIDAHRAPKGARYMVSGMVVKSPKKTVLVSKGRGLGVRGGIDLLGGGKGKGGKAGYGPGELEGGETGTRSIGAVVFEPPKRRIKKKGHLTKEEIARVVKQHLREIQYCYEKNLLRNNKLKGKMIMEWTIVSTGRVSLVKTSFNSMRSPKVARCVSKSIKKMKFPLPRGGGIVEVEYPFLFEQVGFE
jgi:pSer/pThr/pTyr-binding forkhead associated (FHA) protein